MGVWISPWAVLRVPVRAEVSGQVLWRVNDILLKKNQESGFKNPEARCVISGG
jgi:hypothetical protein